MFKQKICFKNTLNHSKKHALSDAFTHTCIQLLNGVAKKCQMLIMAAGFRPNLIPFLCLFSFR